MKLATIPMADCSIKFRFLGVFLPLLLLMGCVFGDETISGYADRETIWQLEQLDGETFPASASLQFPEPGQIRGSGPCNSFTASQTVPYPWIEVKALAATRRACADLKHEQEFFAALHDVTLAEASGDVLILSNETGRTMLFRAVQP